MKPNKLNLNLNLDWLKQVQFLLQADSKIVHFICREWLRPACYRLFEVMLGHFVQAGPI